MRIAALSLAVAGSIVLVAMIRRRAPAGLRAWLSAPGQFVSAGASAMSGTLRGAASSLSARARRHYSDAVGTSAHPFATAVLVTVFALAWAVGTGLYMNRNAAVVLAAHREAVRVGASRPVTGEQIIAFAEVFSPVLLTAAVGIVFFELINVSDHLPFLHGLRIRRRLAIVLAATVVLGVAGLMQYSVARQETAQATSEVLATIDVKFTATVPPIPITPNVDEVDAYNRAVTTFDQSVRQPALRELAASTGPLGWKTWLALGAALLDFVFAWALIPFLVILWAVVLEMVRGVLLGVALAADAVDLVVRSLTDAARSMFNLPAASSPTPTPIPPPASPLSPPTAASIAPRPIPPRRRTGGTRPTSPTSAVSASATPASRPRGSRWNPLGTPAGSSGGRD